MPDMTKYERFCILAGLDIGYCINAIPKTQFTASQRKRSVARIDVLKRIAADTDKGADNPLDDPWITWCLITQPVEEVGPCIAGQP
jgi:hypothetical protein